MSNFQKLQAPIKTNKQLQSENNVFQIIEAVPISINESIAGVANACHLLYEALKVNGKRLLKKKKTLAAQFFSGLSFSYFITPH